MGIYKKPSLVQKTWIDEHALWDTEYVKQTALGFVKCKVRVGNVPVPTSLSSIHAGACLD